MSTQQQEQTVNTKEHKSLTEKRFIIAIVAILFLIGGATLWILNSQGIIQGSWSGILLIIFTVLGIVIGLFQWLFPVTAPSSQQPIASPPPQPTPQIIVHVPQSTQASSQPPLVDKAAYRGIL